MSKVLQLFEGLTPEQAKELRRRILPALSEVRREVMQAVKSDRPHKQGKHKQRLDNGAMQSENTDRDAV